MSKAGKKILAGVREALLVAQGDLDAISRIRVTPSCGCVFCDMKLTPDADGFHRSKDGQEARCAVVAKE